MAEYNLGRVAFLDRGVYSPTESYNKWDFVTTVDSCYLYINVEPSIGVAITNAAYWKCIADGKPSTLAAAAAIATDEAIQEAEDLRVANEAARQLLLTQAIEAAQLAETNAETAETNAETAQGLSESARDASIAAKDLSVTAKNASVVAQGLSEGARDASIAAKDLSVAAKDLAVTAKNDAVAAKNFASGYADAALLSKTAAETAETNAELAETNAEAAAAAFPTTHPEVTFYSRWLADTGTQLDKTAMELAYLHYLSQLPETVFLFNPHMGSKIRTATAQRFMNKVYDMSANNYDAVQATEATQPYATTNASPLSKVGVKYVQGQTQTGLLDFTDKVFAAGDSWTFTVALKPNRQSASANILMVGTGWVWIGSNSININNGSSTFITATYIFESGKTYIIEYQYSNGIGLIKVNSIPLATTVSSAAMTFGKLSNFTGVTFDGILYHAHLTNTRKSEQQSQLDYTFLRSMYPEIEGVSIGYQHWANSNFEATVDGAGNSITEVQNDMAVEMAVNGVFAVSEAPWILAGTSAWQAGSGDGEIKMTADGTTNNYIAQTITAPSANKYVKITYTIGENTLVGANEIRLCNVSANDLVDTIIGSATVGEHSYYARVKSTGARTSISFRIWSTTTSGYITITSSSFLDLGWSDSTLIYNARIAAGDSVLVATRAASMWCHYNNDPALGAIYGKLYNWYAVSQIAANPPRGWRVPSNDDFAQLSTFLGGNTISGGKMKALFGVFNTSASSNSSGASILPNGRRSEAGVFELNTSFGFSAVLNGSAIAFAVATTEITLVNFLTAPTRGLSLRLLRNEPSTPTTSEKTTGYITNNIAVTPYDITGVPFGNSVAFLRVVSETAMTGFQAVLYTGAGAAKETLCTGVAITANVPAYIPITVAQSLQLVDCTVRVSATTKTDTTARVMYNVGLRNAYTNMI